MFCMCFVHQRNIIIIDDYYATKLLGVVNTYLAYANKLVRNVLFPLGICKWRTNIDFYLHFLQYFLSSKWLMRAHKYAYIRRPVPPFDPRFEILFLPNNLYI